MEPDDLLCSRNARPQKTLVGRAEWKIIQPPSPEMEKSGDPCGEKRLPAPFISPDTFSLPIKQNVIIICSTIFDPLLRGIDFASIPALQDRHG
jgi:hypothetical protein